MYKLNAKSLFSTFSSSHITSISISDKELLKLMPNSVSICSLMRSTNVPYTFSQKRARTALPDAEMVPVGGAMSWSSISRLLSSESLLYSSTCGGRSSQSCWSAGLDGATFRGCPPTRWGGGRGTPLYKLYRCVPPQRAVQTYWKTQSDGSGLKTI